MHPRSILLFGCFMAIAPPSQALEWYLPEAMGTLKPYATERFRFHDWDYAESSPFNNDYDYLSSQLRLGVRWDHPIGTAHAAWQYSHLGPLPTGASSGAGAGALYYSNGTLEPESHGTYLKYLELGLKDNWNTGLTATMGRMDYSSGNMYRPTTAGKIEAVKKMRVADRVIGGFGWSEYQRSFDGFKTVYDHPATNLLYAALIPTQGGFEEGAGSSIEDIRIHALEWTLKKDALIPATELQAFVYHWEDSRLLDASSTRPDNTGRTALAGTENDVDLDLFGGHLIGSYELGQGTVDALVWGGYQAGRWYELDHEAWVLAAEAGYQFTGWAWKPWIRGGYNIGSGDTDPSDEKHGTFYQMIPTARLYSQSILYNLMNTEDLFAMLIVKPMPALTVRSDIHWVSLESSADRWYVGGGPMHRSKLTDYTGRASNGENDLGVLSDVSATYELTSNVSVSAYYGHFSGSDIAERFYTRDSNVDYFYLETTVQF